MVTFLAFLAGSLTAVGQGSATVALPFAGLGLLIVGGTLHTLREILNGEAWRDNTWFVQQH